MNLEEIILRATSQSQKHCMIPLYDVSKIVKVIKAAKKKKNMSHFHHSLWIAGDATSTSAGVSGFC